MARILIIDDETSLRGTLRRALEGEGHEVVDAPDGQEGIRLYQEHPADVVVTDILMPGKDGLEVIRELRQMDRQVKIIGISGGGKKGKLEFLSYAEAFGADRVFPKPFDLEEFLDAVDELVGRVECKEDSAG